MLCKMLTISIGLRVKLSRRTRVYDLHLDGDFTPSQSVLKMTLGKWQFEFHRRPQYIIYTALFQQSSEKIFDIFAHRSSLINDTPWTTNFGSRLLSNTMLKQRRLQGPGQVRQPLLNIWRMSLVALRQTFRCNVSRAAITRSSLTIPPTSADE